MPIGWINGRSKEHFLGVEGHFNREIQQISICLLRIVDKKSSFGIINHSFPPEYAFSLPTNCFDSRCVIKYACQCISTGTLSFASMEASEGEVSSFKLMISQLDHLPSFNVS